MSQWIFLIIVICQINWLYAVTVPESPCPKIFYYKKNANEHYGVIKLDSHITQPFISIKVKMSYAPCICESVS